MAEGVKRMKANIHPNYNETVVTCTTCGTTFETGSVKKEIRVDTCSNCHPFYTGKQKFAQADGRVERFNKKFEESKVLSAEDQKRKAEKMERLRVEEEKRLLAEQEE